MRALLALPLASALFVLACSDDRQVAPPPAPVTSSCGNRRVDVGETCDRLIPTSSVGGCPTSCFDGVACTVDRKLGSPEACNVACAFDPISACQAGDGCCPEGCTAATDADCSSTCNNGTVDLGETCDGDCTSSCSDNVACTTDTTYGAAATCSLACGYRVVSACTGGDGCCPADCAPGQDSDCSTTCGNGSVEAPEVCDGNCPTTCVDNDACTIGVLSGSASTCSAACTQQRIRTCTAGDGCCPAGCTNTQDNDCPASCETVTTCTGGDGCCPASCNGATDADCPASCETVTACRAGDGCCPGSCTNANDADCPASCANVTACRAGDGCCPGSCTNANDADCPSTPPPSGVGTACSGNSICLSLLGSSGICYSDGFPDGYCTQFCTSGGCPSGSACDGSNFLCVALCMPSAPNACRTGYRCTTAIDAVTERPFTACLPDLP
jgi:hypothetical protein